MPPTCEFTTPCTTTSTTTSTKNTRTTTTTTTPPPLRKLISHIFGRNKSSTKQIPDEIWVHYCRKHYQRARYRCRNWAREQCELLLVSLDRLEEWGRVEGFEVLLRRREWERLGVDSCAGDSPVGGLGEGKVGGGGGGVGEGGVQGGVQGDIQEGGGEGEEKRRKRPAIQASPVPDWLTDETGSRKSFEEMREIIRRLMKGFQDIEKNEKIKEEVKKKKLQFPDVEILPIFREDFPDGSDIGLGE